MPTTADSPKCFAEVGGPDSRYIDPKDPEAWAVALEQVLTDDAQAEAMRLAGHSYAERFADSRLAESLWSTYRSVLG